MSRAEDRPGLRRHVHPMPLHAVWRSLGVRRAVAQDGLVGLVVSAMLCAPMLVHRYGDIHRAFAHDWTGHLYLIARQASYVEAHHLTPTYFLNTAQLGWFYPFYAFYGGTLFYVAALGARIIGSPWATYTGSYVLAMFAAFFGWTWLARQAGVSGWWAYLPGVVYVCGADYLSILYGLGDWPEFVAISVLPLILAAAWNVITRTRLARRDGALLIGAVAVLSGSHILTLMFGSVFLAAAFGVLLLLRLPPTARPPRLAALAVLAALGVGINGWFLVPLLTYRGTLRIQPERLYFPEFDDPRVIFSLLPDNPLPTSTAQLFVQAPDVPLVAAAIVTLIGVFVVSGWRQRVLALAVAASFALILLLIAGPEEIWRQLPSEALIIQFRYRLNIYLLASAAGLVLVGCRYASQIHTRHRRLGFLARGLLLGAALIQMGFALHQVWSAQGVGAAEDVLTRLDRLPPTLYNLDFLSGVLPKVAPSSDEVLVPDPSTLNASRVDIPVPARLTGGLVQLNVVPSPLVAFNPPTLVGQAENGNAVLSLPASASDAHVEITGAVTPATVAGQMMTIACASAVVVVIGFVLRRRSDTQGEARDETLGAECHAAEVEATESLEVEAYRRAVDP